MVALEPPSSVVRDPERRFWPATAGECGGAAILADAVCFVRSIASGEGTKAFDVPIECVIDDNVWSQPVEPSSATRRIRRP